MTWLASITERLQALPLTYSAARSWGSFTPTNLAEVLAAVGALAAELAAAGRSPYAGGVLRELERSEQLLGGVQRSLQVRRAYNGNGEGEDAHMLPSSC